MYSSCGSRCHTRAHPPEMTAVPRGFEFWAGVRAIPMLAAKPESWKTVEMPETAAARRAVCDPALGPICFRPSVPASALLSRPCLEQARPCTSRCCRGPRTCPPGGQPPLTISSISGARAENYAQGRSASPRPPDQRRFAGLRLLRLCCLARSRLLRPQCSTACIPTRIVRRRPKPRLLPEGPRISAARTYELVS